MEVGHAPDPSNWVRSIANVAGNKLVVENEVIRDVFTHADVRQRKLVVVNLIGRITAMSAADILFNYCDENNVFGPRHEVFGDVVNDGSCICVWKPYIMPKNVAVVFIRTPFIKNKSVFLKALKFSTTFSSSQVICGIHAYDAAAEDVEILKVALRVGKLIGLRSHSFLSNNPNPLLANFEDEPQLGQTRGILALNRLLTKVSSDKQQEEIRQAFSARGCYLTYDQEPYSNGRMSFIKSVFKSYKCFGLCIMTGEMLHDYYEQVNWPKRIPKLEILKDKVSEYIPRLFTASELICLLLLVIVCKVEYHTFFDCTFLRYAFTAFLFATGIVMPIFNKVKKSDEL